MSTENNSHIPFTLLVDDENSSLCSKVEKPRLLELFSVARESPASGAPVQTTEFSLPSDVRVQACNKVVISEGDRPSADKVECTYTREKTPSSDQYEIDLELSLGSHKTRSGAMGTSENVPDLELSLGNPITSSTPIVIYGNDDYTESGQRQAQELGGSSSSSNPSSMLLGHAIPPEEKNLIRVHPPQRVNISPPSSEPLNGRPPVKKRRISYREAVAAEADPVIVKRPQNHQLVKIRPPAPLTATEGEHVDRRLPADHEPVNIRPPAPMPAGPPTGQAVNIRPPGRHGPRSRSSAYTGVTHYKRTGRWEAHIWHDGSQLYLGASLTEVQAARAYDRAAIRFRGAKAELNFNVNDYIGELGQLSQISSDDLVMMLRRQSLGQGMSMPQYPPPRLP